MKALKEKIHFALRQPQQQLQRSKQDRELFEEILGFLDAFEVQENKPKGRGRRKAEEGEHT